MSPAKKHMIKIDIICNKNSWSKDHGNAVRHCVAITHVENAKRRSVIHVGP